MRKKLIPFILLVLWILWFGIGNAKHPDDGSSASEIEKLKAIPIPADRVVQPFHPFAISGEDFCVIYSDSDSVAYYYPDTIPGNGFALFMDPGICGENPYPFKITGVQLYLYDYSNGFTAVWPTEIRVNIRDLEKDSSWFSPGAILCHQIFTIPIDSSYDSLDPYEEPMYLSLDSLTPSTCSVDSPFFLEIIFTGVTAPPFPSLVMSESSLDFPDTCKAWFLYDGNYYEWSETWHHPFPGCPIMRISGYTHYIGVEEEEEIITPEDFQLSQNHPNPFNNETTIKYTLSKSCHVSLVIYNILGQKVRTLVTEYQKAGVKTVSWDAKDEKGKDLGSGIYFYQLSTGYTGKSGEITRTKRMILLK